MTTNHPGHLPGHPPGLYHQAVALLQQIAAGQAVEVAALESLACAVLEEPAVQLAQGILAGGPLQLTRARELAALLVLQERQAARRAS